MAVNKSEHQKKQAAQARALIAQIREKSRKLADEFASGEINRDQFYRIYEHYQQQLNLASAMLAQADLGIPEGLSAGETVVIRKKHTGMAVGAMIVMHATGGVLETIGELATPFSTLMPILSQLSEQRRLHRPVEPQINQYGEEWVLIISGEYSSVLMAFTHEPVARQIELVETMHRDFEAANLTPLKSGKANPEALVFPFISFVQKSVKRKS